MKELETDRLILRKITLDDTEDMFNNWASDPKASEMLDWDVHESVDVTKKVISHWIEEYENGSYNWVVELKDNHEIIGSITAVKYNEKNKTCEIGYCYGSKYWRHGYASEALRRVIEFFLNETCIELVEAKHIFGNPNSGKVMAKAGMTKEATLRKRHLNKKTGEIEDLIVYSITKDEL